MLTASLITLGDPDTLTGGYLYHRRMAELAPRFSARIDFLSFPDRPFPLPLIAGRAIVRHLRGSEAQIALLDSIAAAYVAPWAAALSADLPLIGVLHQPPGGIGHGRVRTAIQSRLDRHSYARTRLLLVASEALAAELEGSGASRHLMRVVPPGRDVAGRSGPPIADPRRGSCVALLCVANWLPHKGILELLEALALLPAGATTLHLAGAVDADAAYTSRIRARLERPDLAGRVVVYGPVSRETVAALYEAADVFILPSLKETYGTVYGEAMSAGLPVVGWDAGNLPHLIDHGGEGLLVPAGDIAGLSRAVLSLAEDVQLRAGLGRAATRRALRRPTWEESAALFFAALREVLSEARASHTANPSGAGRRN